MTVVDAVLAFPIALYMAKVASPAGRRLLVIAVLMPLWASYLVKAYAWRGMFSDGGLIDWLGKPVGLHSPGYGLAATTITLAYLWLPYMVLPIFAGLERVPDSLFEASGDLGAGWLARPYDASCCPMAFPAIIAGSIFTFSLSLGDYIAVQIVGGATQLLGNVVYANVGLGQQPAVRVGAGDRPGRGHARLPRRRPADRRPGQPVIDLPDGCAPCSA